jgi:hypothetical protein
MAKLLHSSNICYAFPHDQRLSEEQQTLFNMMDNVDKQRQFFGYRSRS